MKKLAFTFLFLSIYGLGFAQDSYQYAVVTYHAYSEKLMVYKEGVADERRGVRGSSHYDATPILTEVEKLSNEGWEVYNSNGTYSDVNSSTTFYYFLRRKK
jgi:hypothetical protein